MLIRLLRSFLLLAFWCAPAGFGQPPATRLNPTVKEIVAAVSEERIGATMKRLEGFGTRYILSEQDSPTHGIGAAQRWILDEFKSYSPRLRVKLDPFTFKKGQRVAHDVDLANVVAVLPGTVDADRFVVISSHYDSIAARRGPGTPRTDDEGPRTAQEVEPVAPGVSDNASGVAAVLELARIMSQHEFDKSVVFIAFSAEEVGLLGSQAYAAQARQEKMEIEAVLNNDIIGNDVAGNSRSANSRLRVFSEGPEDSPSRALARYTKEIAERYLPYMTVDLVFRRDRFGRGGDHTSFNREGFRCCPAHHAQRELREPAHGHRYVSQCFRAIHRPSSENECCRTGQFSAGAETSGSVTASRRHAPAKSGTCGELSGQQCARCRFTGRRPKRSGSRWPPDRARTQPG